MNGEIEIGSISFTLNEVLKVDTTTSYKPDQDTNNAEPLPELEPIYESESLDVAESKCQSPYAAKTCCSADRPISATIQFSDRNLLNKMIRLIYLVFKIIYMSVWFYWGGYIVPIASYIYPFENDK